MIKKSIVTVIFGFQIVALTSNARQFTKGEQLTLEYRNGWVLDSDFGRGAYQVSSFSSTPSPHLWTTILQLNVLLKSGKLTDINKFDEKSLTELAQKNIKEIRKDPEYIQMLESHAAGCGQLEIMTLPTMKPTVQERNGATK